MHESARGFAFTLSLSPARPPISRPNEPHTAPDADQGHGGAQSGVLCGGRGARRAGACGKGERAWGACYFSHEFGFVRPVPLAILHARTTTQVPPRPRHAPPHTQAISHKGYTSLSVSLSPPSPFHHLHVTFPKISKTCPARCPRRWRPRPPGRPPARRPPSLGTAWRCPPPRPSPPCPAPPGGRWRRPPGLSPAG